jgi:UDP-N-acetylglucosamine acyltransferase
MKIHSTAIIQDKSKIDDSVEIGPFCIIDEDVEIKKGTKLLSHVVLRGPTVIGEDNIFYQFSTIGEDTPDKKFKGEKTKLEIGDRNITIGALTTIHQFCNIGDYSFIGMNTSINMDIPAFVKVAADPARIIGLNSVGMSRNDISSESISLIKKAYKLVYRKGLKIDEAIKKSKELNKDQNDSFLDIFIKSLEISERGILR